MGLLDAYGPTDEDRKQAKQLGLLQAAFALMGAQKGREMEALGRAGLLGIAGYNQELRDVGKERLQNVAARMGIRREEREEGAYQAAQQQAQALELAKQGAMMRPQQAMPEYGPPTEQGAMQPPVAAQPGGFDFARYAQNLAPIAPEKALALQQSLAKPTRKLKETRSMMMNGQRVTVNLYEDGTHDVLPYSPDAEKAHFTNVGNAVVPVDPFTGKPIGGGLPISQSPDAAASVAAQVRGQNLSAQTAREGHAITAAGQSRPQWDATAGQWMFPPRSGVAGEAVTPQGFNPGAGKKEVASRAAVAIVDKAKPLIEAATGSYVGSGLDQLARVFGMSTEGSLAIGKLKVLEAALVLNQPRMEGPQSDRDAQRYTEAAGAIGDPTVPAEQKLAAVETIRDLHQTYGGIYGTAGSGGRSASGKISGVLTPEQQAAYDKLPAGAEYIGPDGKRRTKK
jgi:hypothetical protein